MDNLKDRAVQARFSARCTVCDEAIVEFDWIVKVDGEWVHLACAEDADA